MYIGDVSSMATDFIVKKNKSCIFINSNKIDWQHDKSFKFWDCGKVINNFEELDSALKSALKENKYDENQKAYSKEMIQSGLSSSSKLIAENIHANINH